MKKIILSMLAVLTVMSFTGCKDKPSVTIGAEDNLSRIHSQYFDVEIIEDLGGVALYSETKTLIFYMSALVGMNPQW